MTGALKLGESGVLRSGVWDRLVVSDDEDRLAGEPCSVGQPGCESDPCSPPVHGSE